MAMYLGSNKVEIGAVTEGGGGSSDFSTATVTYIRSGGQTSGVFTFNAPIIIETYAEMSSVGQTLVASSTSQTIDIILYKGASYVYIDGVSSISGDIEEDEDGYYFITGDCTITIS